MNDLKIYSLKNFETLQNDIFMLGSFESFHLGHYQIYKKAQSLKKENQRLILVTFKQETFDFKNKGSFFQSNNANYFNLVELEFDAVLEIDFQEIKNLQALEFLNLLKKDKAINLCFGQDFKLGKDKQALNEIDLKLIHNINLHMVEIFKFKNKKISTSFLKELVTFGDIKFLNELLVYNFTIEADLKENELTANRKQLLPHAGFYVAKVYLNNLIYFSIIQVNKQNKLKWHLIDLDELFQNSIKDGKMYIELLDKIHLTVSDYDDFLQEEFKEKAKKYFLESQL
ncbi:FAD synthase [Mycoplasmopsis edwardii]|nr:hypothetical protein [Mycoplasmopsis edwardii]